MEEAASSSGSRGFFAFAVRAQLFVRPCAPFGPAHLFRSSPQIAIDTGNGQAGKGEVNDQVDR